MKLVVSIMPRSLEEAQQLDSSRYEDADVIEWSFQILCSATTISKRLRKI